MRSVTVLKRKDTSGSFAPKTRFFFCVTLMDGSKVFDEVFRSENEDKADEIAKKWADFTGFEILKGKVCQKIEEWIELEGVKTNV